MCWREFTSANVRVHEDPASALRNCVQVHAPHVKRFIADRVMYSPPGSGLFLAGLWGHAIYVSVSRPRAFPYS